MAETHFATCPLCEAICGLTVEVEDGKLTSVRGDPEDHLSRGYLCPKAVGLIDIHQDPDRVTRPLRRDGTRWIEADWDEAFESIGAGIHRIQKEHGKDAVGFYYGNPTAHAYSSVLYGILFRELLGSKNAFSSNSVDALPRLFVSLLMYGSQAILPIPDLERTKFLLILGANPAVSNGSVMTAPDVKKRIERIRARGGKVIVVDPRKTETANIADEHLFIRPGTDALLLAAMVHIILDEKLDKLGRLAAFVDGLSIVKNALAPFTRDKVAAAVGIPEERILRLAREFAAADGAGCYGRLGTCVQDFGATTSWLVDVLNIVTGNLDHEGGMMFATPAVDLARLAAMIGQKGSFDTFRSRVRGLPEFNGELPAAALADEIETEGRGRIKGLVTLAGNPVLSVPDGKRLDRALDSLDLMVSIDLYVNETTRHANWILPPSFALEHDHYPLLFHALAVHNTAHYSKPVLPRPEGVRHDWEILLSLGRSLEKHRGGARRLLGALGGNLVEKLGPRGILSLLLRLGGKTTLSALENAPHGIDLGALEPRFPEMLGTPKKTIRLAPRELLADVPRLTARLEAPSPKEGELLLVGRRDLRSNNSWMHNSARLIKGKRRDTLLMHPSDATRRGLVIGDVVRVASPIGAVEAPLEITESMMPGTVSLPHGFGHGRAGVRMRVASAHAGTSVNDLLDAARIDPVCGASSVTGVPVDVSRA
jgi:anaerobic selenocysteine-containing dehydrogenase